MLLDRIVERQSDRLVAAKNVTSAEEYLADHFPRFAVLPGVMMLETMVQAARELLAGENVAGGPWVLGTVRQLRYGQLVRPGQCLTVEVTRRGPKDDGWEFQGVGTVNGQVAVQGKFQLSPLPRA